MAAARAKKKRERAAREHQLDQPMGGVSPAPLFSASTGDRIAMARSAMATNATVISEFTRKVRENNVGTWYIIRNTFGGVF